MPKKNLFIGLGEIAIGAILISPADEIATAIGSGGTSLLVAPQQLAGTAVIGLVLLYDGIKRI